MPGQPEALRVVIVDDEDAARLSLRQQLRSMPGVEIVAECENGFEAVKAVAELNPDLLLLDIQMPKLDGFEVLELIGGSAAVVFVTAYDEYAVKAFEVCAVDYLLKPFPVERLRAAIERARARIERRETAQPGTPPLKDLVRIAHRGDATAHRILVRDGGDVTVIPVDALDYVKAQDDYVELHFRGRSQLKQQTLSDLAATLDPARFVRIHRSYLLNIDRLRKIELYAKDSREAVLTDGTRLPISRAGYERLQELI